MYDEDTINQINRENWKQFEWEMEMRNKILRIANTDRKQKEWNKYFGVRTEPDDSWLLEAKVF